MNYLEGFDPQAPRKAREAGDRASQAFYALADAFRRMAEAMAELREQLQRRGDA